MIHVNGDAMEWNQSLTVREVLVRRNFRFPLLIITVNGDLIQPKEYESTAVPDAADVQVVHLMSGG